MPKAPDGKKYQAWRLIHKFYGYLRYIFLMKSLIIVITVLFSNVCFSQIDTGNFHILYQTKTVSISAEKVLYQHSKSEHYFIRYQIKNLSENNLGIYLDKYFGLFYPNQWGIEQKPERGAIDERRIIPSALNDSILQSMVDKYHNDQLTLLPPNGTFDYYRDFNASDKKDVHLKRGEFMFVSMDGQLLMTDGSKVEHAHFDDRAFDNGSIFLPYPLVWKKIPTGSKTFYEN